MSTRTTTSPPAACCAAGLRVTRARRVLLDDVSLNLVAGELTVVIGANGAGKSSLIRAVSGEWHYQGALALFGKARAHWQPRALAQRLAVMPQQSNLAFDFSVREVVALGRLPHPHLGRAHNAQQVDAILHELELDGLAGRAFTTLSGGERQRVQFARVLAQIAGNEAQSLLLLDEPTAALDLAQQSAILRATRKRVAQGAAVLAVVHDLNLAARAADRVLVLRQGRVLARGSVADTYRAPVLRAAYGVDVVVERAADGAPVVLAQTCDKMVTHPDSGVPHGCD